MSNPVSQLAGQIETNFVNGLKGLALTNDEALLVTSISNRLANLTTLYQTVDTSLQSTVRGKIDEDLASLEQIAVSKQIDAQVLLRQTVLDTVQEFVTLGVKGALAGIA